MTIHKTLGRMEQERNQKKNNAGLPIALGVGLLLSLGFNAYQYIDHKNDQETLEKSVKELSSLSSAKSQLEFDYKNLQDEYEQLKNSIVDNDGLLANKEHDISVNQEEIQRILNDANASKEDLAKAESMIKSLRSEITNYKNEIIRLKNENAILVKDNAVLTKNNASLTNQRDSISTNLRVEKIERQVERQVAQQKEDELSSTLSISNHKITPIKVRSNGKEVEKDRAKKVNKIRVSFDVDRNSRATSGEKDIYVSIRKPNGQIGHFNGAQSGVLTLRSGDQVNYSDKVNINYQNGAGQTVSFDWEDSNFEPGTYKIDIYQNGFKISQANLVLR